MVSLCTDFNLADFSGAARLLYTTGNITEAVRTFLGTLRVLEYPTLQPVHDQEGEYSVPSYQDKTFLDDFRVAFAVEEFFFCHHLVFDIPLSIFLRSTLKCWNRST